MTALHLEVDRVQDGKATKKTMLATLTDACHGELPILHIESGWQPRKQRYKDKTDYTVEEIPCDMDGRGFQLVKCEDGEVYSVFICSRGLHTCSCAGGTYREYCKHQSALVALLAQCCLADPKEEYVF